MQLSGVMHRVTRSTAPLPCSLTKRFTPGQPAYTLNPRLRSAARIFSTSDHALRTTKSQQGSLVPLGGESGVLTEFPAGIHDFYMLRSGGYAYFDRTSYISVINSLNRYLLFLRPRRFGKSLTISMLESFHGLEHKDDYEMLFKGLSIDQDVQAKRIRPNRYLILKFNFSQPGPADGGFFITNMINDAIEEFYETYAPYLGEETPSELVERYISPDNAVRSFSKCVKLVRRKLKKFKGRKRGGLAGINGIYVLIDEYDALSNTCLDPDTISWGQGYPSGLLKSFYAALNNATGSFMVERFFITGIAPVALAGISNGFGIETNVSFNSKLSGLCGLTREDVRGVLKKLPPRNDGRDELSDLEAYVNGYYFCSTEKDEVKPVFNTTTCLDYFKYRSSGDNFSLEAPPHSEINETFLELCALSPIARENLQEALRLDPGLRSYCSVEYSCLGENYKLQDMRAAASSKSLSLWQSYLLYYGAYTFDCNNPSKYLRIPNHLAAERIVAAILARFDLYSRDLDKALDTLSSTGNITKVLELYQRMMTLSDVTEDDFKKDESLHARTVQVTLLKNVLLGSQPEFKVSHSTSGSSGCVDLVMVGKDRVMVVEWRAVQIGFLDIPITYARRAHLSKLERKAYILTGMSNVDQVLGIKFAQHDKFRPGKTIGDWVCGVDDKSPASQVRLYMESPEISKLDPKLNLQAYLVVIIGNRKILVWTVNRKGELGDPKLV